MADGASKGRPLSPHLQIWRFTATMAASITHRATGAALYGGFLLLAFWVTVLEMHGPSFTRATAFINSPIGFIIIAGFVWSLSFHLFNGLRHLYWDTGRGLAKDMATMTAWIVYIASFALTALILWARYGGGA